MGMVDRPIPSGAPGFAQHMLSRTQHDQRSCLCHNNSAGRAGRMWSVPSPFFEPPTDVPFCEVFERDWQGDRHRARMASG